MKNEQTKRNRKQDQGDPSGDTGAVPIRGNNSYCVRVIRVEDNILPLCRRVGFATNLFNGGSMEFLEVGKRPDGGTKRQATSGQVVSFSKANSQFKELVSDLSLKNAVLKKLGWYRRRSGQLMRFTRSDKMEIMRMVQGSQINVKRMLEERDVSRASFCRW